MKSNFFYLDNTDADPVEFDFCIIGSGPAAMSLTSKFLDTDISICILESGNKKLTPSHLRLNEALSVGEREVDALNSRPRRYGGSSQVWAGTSAPFSIHEFENRPELGLEGWPISWNEIINYYQEACNLTGVEWKDFNKPVSELDTQLANVFEEIPGSNLRSNNYFAAKHKDLTKLLKKKIENSSNMKIFLNATVSKISSEGGIVKNVNARSIDGKKIKINAKFFVICAGALETTRILLNSDIFSGESNCLGKNFMTHPAFTGLGNIKLNKKTKNWIKKSSLKKKIDFELNFDQQKKLKILRHNITMVPNYEKIKIKIKNLVQSKFATNLIFFSLDLFFRFFGKRMWTDEWSVCVGIEQEPISKRRLTLSKEIDAFGSHKLIIDAGKLSELEERTISCALDELKKVLIEKEVGELILSENFLSKDYLKNQDPINHHIGTVKMGLDSKNGFVDENLKVFEQKNLFISSSAVFPTSSNANPTLTIIALSLRLADHLKNIFEKQL